MPESESMNVCAALISLIRYHAMVSLLQVCDPCDTRNNRKLELVIWSLFYKFINCLSYGPVFYN